MKHYVSPKIHITFLNSEGLMTIGRHSLVVIISAAVPLGNLCSCVSWTLHPLLFLQPGSQVSEAIYHDSCIAAFLQNWE